jgi:excisionase family DNA binding protein
MRKRVVTEKSPEKRKKGHPLSDGAVQRIKIKDIARKCMVSQTTVRRWIESGQLRAFKLPSGHYRINQVDYRRFLKEIGISDEKSAFESKS